MPKPDRPILDLRTACACGAVAVHVHGPVVSMLMCSCVDCQKATGTGHATIALFRIGNLTVTGAVKSFTRPAASGATLTRHFCPECGTPLYGASSRAPEMAMLPVGLFGAETAWFAPNQLVFSRSHRDWDAIAADLPHYQTYRDEEGA